MSDESAPSGETQGETQEMVFLLGLHQDFRDDIRKRVESAPNIKYIVGLDKETVLDLLGSIDHLEGQLANQTVERIKGAKDQLEAHANANEVKS